MSKLLYLADLTHTGQIVASNVMPLGIGLVGAYVKQHLPHWEVELFKYPEDLGQAIRKRPPDVLGLSNYSWNFELSLHYARKFRDSIRTIVMGGPNIGDSGEEMVEFWNMPGTENLDYYIHREGEVTMVDLLRRIELYDEDLQTLAAANLVDGVSYVLNGQIMRGSPRPRIKELDDVPSPYLMGLMDKFFDGVLIPLVHSTRGCPFHCTFCQEGHKYYNVVAKRTGFAADIEYIAQRRGTLQDLYISDANFGMFAEDRDKALAIAQCQKDYGWPMYIHVSGGKNKKERLLDVASIIGGRMGVAASLQSTDPQVLRNVKRENISSKELIGVAREGSRIDANTYAEIILHLPGDTRKAHVQSLREAVEAGLSYLRMYQLILLPSTEMNNATTRKKFGMVTKWRVMPRCFGKYEGRPVTEAEEIVIAQDSMSFQDYMYCREMALAIELFHNTGMFREVQQLCLWENQSWFDLIVLAFETRKKTKLRNLFGQFKRRTKGALHDTRQEAIDTVDLYLGQYITDRRGVNELFNAKAIGFFKMADQLHASMYAMAERMMPDRTEYLREAFKFSLLRKSDLLKDSSVSFLAKYDFMAMLEKDFDCDPDDFKLEEPKRIDFHHTQEQRELIDQLVRQYGTSETGLGRIMLRAHIKKLFRTVQVDEATTDKGFETVYRRASNLYGD